MRVAILSDWMEPAGGAETYIRTLHSALCDAGHTVATVLCGPALNGVPQGAKHYPVESSNSQFVLAGRQIFNTHARAAVQQMMREFLPDVAIVGHFAYHLSPAAVLALDTTPHAIYLMDYKSICPLGSKLLPTARDCTVHSGIVCVGQGCVSLPHWLRDRPRYALMTRARQRASVLISPSTHVQSTLAAEGVLTRCLAQPVMLPSTSFARTPSATPRFVYAGRLSAEKGVQILLEAFARLRERLSATGRDVTPELRIAGDGSQRGALEREALRIGGVTMLGTCSASTVEQELAHAWAVVVPSIWNEPYGLIALEAMVRGVPVVASASGGLRENVRENVTGLLCEPGDANAITNALWRLIADSPFPSGSLSVDAVSAAQRAWSPAKHVEQLLAMIEAGDVTHGKEAAPSRSPLS